MPTIAIKGATLSSQLKYKKSPFYVAKNVLVPSFRPRQQNIHPLIVSLIDKKYQLRVAKEKGKSSETKTQLS